MCKIDKSIPCQQSPHLFAVCIFVVFPWPSQATDTTAMKRPGNKNYKIRNRSQHLGDECRKKSIEMTIKPVELCISISSDFKASRTVLLVYYFY